MDAQSILALLIVLCAVAYVLRRALSRLRALASKGDAAACGDGCGKCGVAASSPSQPRRRI